MAMPVNMILVMYVILCILSYDFNKLTMLYIHVHISSYMTNKSGLTFFLSIKYLSVCLSDGGFKHTALKAEHISKGSVLALSSGGWSRKRLFLYGSAALIS